MEDMHGTIGDDGTPKLAQAAPPVERPADATAFANPSDGVSSGFVQNTTFHEYIIAPNSVPGTGSDTTGTTNNAAQSLPGVDLTNTSQNPAAPIQQTLAHFHQAANDSVAPVEIKQHQTSNFQFAAFNLVSDVKNTHPTSSAHSAQATELQPQLQPTLGQHEVNAQAFSPSATTDSAIPAPATPATFQFASFNVVNDVAPPAAGHPVQNPLPTALASTPRAANSEVGPILVVQQVAAQVTAPLASLQTTQVAAPSPTSIASVDSAQGPQVRPDTFQFAAFNEVTSVSPTRPQALQRNVTPEVAPAAPTLPVALLTQPGLTAQAFAPVTTNQTPAATTEGGAVSPKPAGFQFASFNYVSEVTQPAAAQTALTPLPTVLNSTRAASAEVAQSQVIQQIATPLTVPVAAPMASLQSTQAAAPLGTAIAATGLSVETAQSQQQRPAAFQFAAFNEVTSVASARPTVPAPSAQLGQLNKPAEIIQIAQVGQVAEQQPQLLPTQAAQRILTPEVAPTAAAAATTDSGLAAPKPNGFQFASFNYVSEVTQPVSAQTALSPLPTVLNATRVANAEVAQSQVIQQIATPLTVPVAAPLASLQAMPIAAPGAINAAPASLVDTAQSQQQRPATFQFAGFNEVTSVASARLPLPAQSTQLSQVDKLAQTIQTTQVGQIVEQQPQLLPTPQLLQRVTAPEVVSTTPANQIASVGQPSLSTKAFAPAITNQAPASTTDGGVNAPKPAGFQFASFNYVSEVTQPAAAQNALNPLPIVSASAPRAASVEVAQTPVIQQIATPMTTPVASPLASLQTTQVAAPLVTAIVATALSVDTAQSQQQQQRPAAFQFSAFNEVTSVASARPTVLAPSAQLGQLDKPAQTIQIAQVGQVAEQQPQLLPTPQAAQRNLTPEVVPTAAAAATTDSGVAAPKPTGFQFASFNYVSEVTQPAAAQTAPSPLPTVLNSTRAASAEVAQSPVIQQIATPLTVPVASPLASLQAKQVAAPGALNAAPASLVDTAQSQQQRSAAFQFAAFNEVTSVASARPTVPAPSAQLGQYDKPAQTIQTTQVGQVAEQQPQLLPTPQAAQRNLTPEVVPTASAGQIASISQPGSNVQALTPTSSNTAAAATTDSGVAAPKPAGFQFASFNYVSEVTQPAAAQTALNPLPIVSASAPRVASAEVAQAPVIQQIATPMTTPIITPLASLQTTQVADPLVTAIAAPALPVETAQAQKQRPAAFQFAAFNEVTSVASTRPTVPAPSAQLSQSEKPAQTIQIAQVGPVVEQQPQLLPTPQPLQRVTAPEVIPTASASQIASISQPGTNVQALTTISSNTAAAATMDSAVVAPKPAIFQFASFNYVSEVTQPAAAQNALNPLPIVSTSPPRVVSAEVAQAPVIQQIATPMTTPVITPLASLQAIPTAAPISPPSAAPAAIVEVAQSQQQRATFQFVEFNEVTNVAATRQSLPAPVTQVSQQDKPAQTFQIAQVVQPEVVSVGSSSAIAPINQPGTIAQAFVPATSNPAPTATADSGAVAPRPTSFQFASFNYVNEVARSASAQPAQNPSPAALTSASRVTSAEITQAPVIQQVATPVATQLASLQSMPIAAPVATTNAAPAAFVETTPSQQLRPTTFQFDSFDNVSDVTATRSVSLRQATQPSQLDKPAQIVQVAQIAQPGGQQQWQQAPQTSQRATTPEIVQTASVVASTPLTQPVANAQTLAASTSKAPLLATADSAIIADNTLARSLSSENASQKSQPLQVAAYVAFGETPVAPVVQKAINGITVATDIQAGSAHADTNGAEKGETTAQVVSGLQSLVVGAAAVAAAKPGALAPASALVTEHTSPLAAEHAPALTAGLATPTKLDGIDHAVEPTKVGLLSPMGAIKTLATGQLANEHGSSEHAPDSKVGAENIQASIKLLSTDIIAPGHGTGVAGETKISAKDNSPLPLLPLSKGIKLGIKDEKENDGDLVTSAKVVSGSSTGAGQSGGATTGNGLGTASGLTAGTSMATAAGLSVLMPPGSAATSEPGQTSVSATLIDPITGLPLTAVQSAQNSLPGLQIIDGEKSVKTDNSISKNYQHTGTQRIDTVDDIATKGIVATAGGPDENKTDDRRPEIDNQDLIVATEKPTRGQSITGANFTNKNDTNAVKDPNGSSLGASLQAIFDSAKGKREQSEAAQSNVRESRYDPEKTHRHLITEDETLESIAELLFQDEDLAGLLYEINNGFWKSRKKKGKIALEFGPGATIFLPTKKEIAEYRQRMMLTPQARLQFEYSKTQSTTSLRQILQARQRELANQKLAAGADNSHEQKDATDFDATSNNNGVATTKNIPTGSPTMYFSSEILRITRPTDRNLPTRQLQAKHLQALTQNFVPDLKQQLSNIEQNSRIIVEDAEISDNFFNARVEYHQHGQWSPVVEYQVNQDFAILLAYKGDGKKQKVDLNLPAEVLRQMAETDLQNNRVEYCRKFILGRRILA